VSQLLKQPWIMTRMATIADLEVAQPGGALHLKGAAGTKPTICEVVRCERFVVRWSEVTGVALPEHHDGGHIACRGLA
jgi:hypothetical protein